MNSADAITHALATIMLAGGLDVESAVERSSQLLGRRYRWLKTLALRVRTAFIEQTRPRHRDVKDFIDRDRGFCRAIDKYELEVVDLSVAHPAMFPVPQAAGWELPVINSGSELADWLGITIGELEWFADCYQLGYKRNRPRLRHYHYRILAKRWGQVRLIESPKPRLKQLQRIVLNEFIERIPPHEAAHGFRKGRSITSFAAGHVGRRVVLRLDLRDFFATIRFGWVAALFRTVGYPETVADLLAGLCTNAAPGDVWDQAGLKPADPESREVRWRYAERHLPQGAPTSPALANLCAYRLDCRLAKLAETAGAVYTRYADDLAFSGDVGFVRSIKRFRIHVAATILEEGFRLQDRKTRIMRRGVRQRLVGLVVNEHLNIPRADFDRLKATLTNCIRLGPNSQNRSGHPDFHGHLDGRVSYVEMVDPQRGRKLRALLDQIVWHG